MRNTRNCCLAYDLVEESSGNGSFRQGHIGGDEVIMLVALF
ncbi:MAG: hypothetical protein ACLVG5_00765 [Clostridium sp.]